MADPYAQLGIPNPAQQQAMQEQALLSHQEQQSGGALGGIVNQHADLVRWQLDQEDVLVKIENLLRGNVWTGQEWAPKGKKLMNELGIRTFLTLLSGFCHKGIPTSNYTEQEINARLLKVHRTVANIIYTRWEEFGIDSSDAEFIWDTIVMGQIEPTYRRAKDSTYLKFLSTTNRQIYSQTANNQPQESQSLFRQIIGK